MTAMTPHGKTPHPAIEELYQWFDCSHLKPELQKVVEPFRNCAAIIWNASALGEMVGAETTVAMRKLLEGKDAAVRASIAASRS